MSAGFYKRRRGILEHLESGRISLLDLAVHDYLNLKANLVIGNGFSIPAGVCITSARAIHATCPSQISERAVQRSLEHLRKIGWIKTWNIRGKRGNYPILVCRGSVHDLSGNEYRVNAQGTTDWRHPTYVPVGDLSSLPFKSDVNLSTDRDVRVESREETPSQKTTSPSTSSAATTSSRRLRPAPGDSRFQPFFQFAYDSFVLKHGRNPLWQGKDQRGLKHLLKNQGAESLPSERLQILWQNYLDSTETFTAKQGDSLAYFCSNIDKYSDGPILAASGKGKGNAKLDPNEAVAITMHGAAINVRSVN